MPQIQGRIPQDHYDQLMQLGGDRSSHVKAAIAMYVDSFRVPAKVERIQTAKKKVMWKPLSEHTKSRMAVLRVFELHSPLTTSDAAHWLAGFQPSNNVAKRVQELAAEGYLTPTGEYRKSRNSGKMLRTWKRTSKELPCS